METIEGYKNDYEKKNSIMHVRMDNSMINQLNGISRRTGISVSEIIRESVRRVLIEVELSGGINLKLK